ncbi:DNA-methyltransferase [Ensifer aridi]|uniref:DNA-methyltransferase n=1 Tax=Ensifer aridi TaxID=1708715 RepID=UPI001FCDB1F7|nr:site-specific DNA-methyltransferase [Ensifer aridi]
MLCIADQIPPEEMSPPKKDIVTSAEEIGDARFLAADVLEGLQRLDPASCALVISSPPYNIGKPYERTDERTYDEYLAWQRQVIETMLPALTENASVCWQVGTYITGGELFPLDVPFIEIFRSLGFRLRNRIIWRYNFGYNADKRFSGRYETILWFSRTNTYTFNLDPVRIPQLYPGKRHSASKGKKAGKPSGNPLGKNPSDYWEFSAAEDFQNNPVWDVPNVKANHPEHTEHPCQFPVELAERCVLALSKAGETVLDPFIGTGATAIAAVKHGRHAVGIDRYSPYLTIAEERIAQYAKGDLALRPLGKPIRRPRSTERVAQVPLEWRQDQTESEPGSAGGEDGEG